MQLSCKRREISCDISFGEFSRFTETSQCVYCDGQVNWTAFSSSIRRVSYASNLDRKDNSLGYSADNCVVCCRDCNKGDRFSYEEFLLLSPILKQIRRARHGA